MRRWPALACALTLLSVGPSCVGDRQPEPSRDTGDTGEAGEAAQEQPDVVDTARRRAETAARALGRDLKQRLLREFREGGPSQALTVCSDVAQELAVAHSTDGLTVRRTSLRVRNPANAPDAFEEAALRTFEALHREGRLPEDRTEIEVTAEGRRLRYLSPIFVGELCLRCHGPGSSIDAGVRTSIAELYPEDRAVGYATGDLRGAISVIVPLDRESPSGPARPL